MAEKGHGDVGLLVLALAAVGVARLAGEVAEEVFGELSFTLPFEFDLRGCDGGGGVGLGAVEGGGGRLAEGLLGHGEGPVLGGVPG